MKSIKVVIAVALLLFAVIFMVSCGEGNETKKTEKNEPVKEKIEETSAPERESETEEIVIPELEEPSEELLQRIEDDYYEYNKTRNKNAEYHYVTRYYGEYNGYVPVMFSTSVPVAPAEFEMVISFGLDGKIYYTNHKAIEVWKDGEFYNLDDLCRKKEITNEHIDSISKIHNTGNYIVPETAPAEPVDSHHPSPSAPEKELLIQIAKDYYDYQVEYCKFDPKIDGAIYIERYYGNFDGAVPVLIEGTGLSYSQAVIYEEIAGYIFRYSYGNKIKVWKNGEFYSLQEVFDKGYLTKEQIATINATKPITFDVMEVGYPG